MSGVLAALARERLRRKREEVPPELVAEWNRLEAQGHVVFGLGGREAFIIYLGKSRRPADGRAKP